MWIYFIIADFTNKMWTTSSATILVIVLTTYGKQFILIPVHLNNMKYFLIFQLAFAWWCQHSHISLLSLTSSDIFFSGRKLTCYCKIKYLVKNCTQLPSFYAIIPLQKKPFCRIMLFPSHLLRNIKTRIEVPL